MNTMAILVTLLTGGLALLEWRGSRNGAELAGGQLAAETPEMEAGEASGTTG